MAKANKKPAKKPAKKNAPLSGEVAEDTGLEALNPEVIEAADATLVAPGPAEFPTIDEDDASLANLPSTSTDPVGRYMAEVRRYPLLTREEEYKLAVHYRETGDREAAQRLVTSNLRFVVKVAMEYSKFGAKLIDLIQEGNVGLMQAVKDFNPYKGVRLITYAVWWIRGHIQEFLMRHYSMVRIGTTHNQRKLFYELQRSRAQLERMGMEAGLMQISGRMGIPEDEVKAMSERVLQRDVSLDKPSVYGDKSTLLDVMSSVESTDAEEQLGHHEELELLKENISKIRPDLNEREIFLLENRLLADEPLTLQEVGDRYKITREAVRQLEARLISKIKKQMIEASD